MKQMYFVAPANGNFFRKKNYPRWFCIHCANTSTLIQGNWAKVRGWKRTNLPWTGLFSVGCTTVFKSEFAWKICKHEIKFRHHVSRVMAYTKIWLFFFIILINYHFCLKESYSYSTQNHPLLPLYSDSLKLHLVKPRTVRADSFLE